MDGMTAAVVVVALAVITYQLGRITDHVRAINAKLTELLEREDDQLGL